MYKYITSLEEMDKFNNEISFHDSLLRELSMVNRSYVAKNKSMIIREHSDMRLIFQSQWPVTAIEVIFEEVIECNITPCIDIWGAHGTITYERLWDKEKKHIEFKFDGSVIKARKMKYRLLGEEYLEIKLHTVEEVPVGEIKECILVRDENNWVQCPHCFDAWEEKSIKQIVRCPSCQSQCWDVRK